MTHNGTAQIFNPLEVNFLAHICFMSVKKNFQVQLMMLTLIYCRKSRILTQKMRNQEMHVIYIILSLHAKNQPPMTILSYV